MALKQQAAEAHVQTFAIIYKGPLSEPDDVITTMIPNAITVDSAAGIATALAAISARMADRYHVTFPGHDPTTTQGLAWDGAPHDLVVRIGETETAPVTLTLAPVWSPPPTDRFPWWIAVAGGALLLVVSGALLARKRHALVASTSR